MAQIPDVKALVFDVFGTVVDWRSSVARHAEALAKTKGVTLDPIAFAEAWRGRYQPQLETVRSGKRPWTILDVLHRESLVALLPEFGLEGKLSETEIDAFNKAWHDLDPWPDVVSGLTRLKSRYVIGPQSNGNIAIMVNLAKKQGLPWDVILGAEVVRNYKPVPQSYTDCCRILGLPPRQVMMVAAHNNDLDAAQKQGLSTAFVARPTEKGPGQKTDLTATGNWDIVARDFNELADRLGV